MLCHRPAPVQLSYLGYPGPTYLRSIDGWLGDSVLFEELNQVDRSAHKLIKLEGGYMVFDSGGALPTPKRTAGRRFRFGSFNHARKLTQATIDLFCQVMADNPEAELVLKSISFCEAAEQQRIRHRFEKSGLRSERLILLNWVENGLNHLQRYSEVDVALDPIPYGGATTTAEALWMGVPVVALAGKGMVGRLAGANMPEWIAQNRAGYIKLAQEHATRVLELRANRDSLRRQLQASLLGNASDLVLHLEAAFSQMYVDVFSNY